MAQMTGHIDPDILLGKISAKTSEKWEHYRATEPWPEEKIVYVLVNMATKFAGALLKKQDGSGFTPEDFLPPSMVSKEQRKEMYAKQSQNQPATKETLAGIVGKGSLASTDIDAIEFENPQDQKKWESIREKRKKWEEQFPKRTTPPKNPNSAFQKSLRGLSPAQKEVKIQKHTQGNLNE